MYSVNMLRGCNPSNRHTSKHCRAPSCPNAARHAAAPCCTARAPPIPIHTHYHHTAKTHPAHIAILASACVILTTASPCLAQQDSPFAGRAPARDPDTMLNVPGQLDSADESTNTAPLSSLFQGPNARAKEVCTKKCISTCLRGGEGMPGLGPLSMRREIIVFKEGFRDRKYCLSECATVCSLMEDAKR